MILCMTEKPSVAQDVARVLNIATDRKQGYYEGKGFIVTWCVGHLVSLAEPECYQEDYGYLPHKDIYNNPVAAMQQLPLFPEKWKYTVIDNAKSQFKIVKKLMERDDVDRIYDLGDCGNEGVILQAMVRMKAGNGWGFNDGKKPVYRWNATSMVDEAIDKAIKEITPPDEAQRKYFPIIQGELCKKQADWILGMSMSRAETIKYGSNITVGRVQSPTLAFVVARYMEVQRFKVTNYYTLQADVQLNSSGFSVFWNKDTDNVFPVAVKDSENRVLDGAKVEAKAAEIKSARIGTVTEYSCSKKTEQSPQLYDTATLQMEANQKYGYPAALTLAAAQALYEKYKVTTYPRVESRYITTALQPYLKERVEQISTIAAYADSAQKLLATGITADGHIIDDSKVDDHHAIIPTEKIKNFDFSTIEMSDKNGLNPEVITNILNMILTRFIVALAPQFVYNGSKVTVSFPNGIKMNASGKTPIQMGWKAYQKSLNGKEEPVEETDEPAEQMFPNMSIGDKVQVQDCKTIGKKTTPPKYHTEATLLKAMLNAGSRIENGAILKGKGIGTQATRAEIIKGLFDTRCVKNLFKGKTAYIVPTEKGISVIRCLPKELYSPAITADWELKISKISHGEYTTKQFMDSFRCFINEKLEQVKNAGEIPNLRFEATKETFGTCPICKESPVYRKEKKEGKSIVRTFYCSKKECPFLISTNHPVFKSRMGKFASEEQIKKLISDGYFVAQCTAQKTGKKYKLLFGVQVVDKKNDDGTIQKRCDIVTAFPQK